ncbi:MAG: ABC transporter substrate-binding protein [Desulfobacteraceae bacterium]|nr:MAG: ABC transporter substrate-binding protein [Desulfobacteraceae bacterium]
MHSIFSRSSGIVLSIAVLIAVFGAGISDAQDIKGTVKIVVPYPPGGGTDVISRLVAEKIKSILGQTVIIENKPGAGGIVGTQYAKGLPADGTTLLAMNPALFVVNPMVYSNLPYDTDKDFAPVSQAQTYRFCVAVPAASPIKDFKGLIEWLKKNPQQANYGTPAAGSLPHFFGMMISKYAGVELVHSSFNGSAKLVTALIGNQIPMAVDNYESQMPFHPEKTRILATSGSSRKQPDVPTFLELGYKEMDGEGWNGYVTPGKTPKPIVDKLSSAIREAIKAPEIREKAKQLGMDPTGTTAEEFAGIIKRDREKWGPIIKASGFKVD